MRRAHTTPHADTRWLVGFAAPPGEASSTSIYQRATIARCKLAQIGPPLLMRQLAGQHVADAHTAASFKVPVQASDATTRAHKQARYGDQAHRWTAAACCSASSCTIAARSNRNGSAPKFAVIRSLWLQRAHAMGFSARARVLCCAQHAGTSTAQASPERGVQTGSNTTIRAEVQSSSKAASSHDVALRTRCVPLQ